MKFPEAFRSKHPLGFPHKRGDNFGWFMVPHPKKGTMIDGKFTPIFFAIQADDQTNWGHVSVSLSNRTPTWDEMVFIKNLFWNDDETVVQYHPPKKDYVNIAENCLHLWCYKGEMPRPPKIYVG